MITWCQYTDRLYANIFKLYFFEENHLKVTNTSRGQYKLAAIKR